MKCETCGERYKKVDAVSEFDSHYNNDLSYKDEMEHRHLCGGCAIEDMETTIRSQPGYVAPGAEDEDEDEEALSVEDAADIWLSNGMDEDYMSGYTDEELRRAANQ